MIIYAKYLGKKIYQIPGENDTWIRPEKQLEMTDAKKEADGILRTAEERSKAMISQENVLRQAQKRADKLITTTQKQTREMRRVSGAYVDDLMRRADEGLTANLASLRNTRQSIRAVASHGGKAHKK